MTMPPPTPVPERVPYYAAEPPREYKVVSADSQSVTPSWDSNGFQLWANLPASQKMMEPRYRDVGALEIPDVSLDSGAKVRIIAGNVMGRAAGNPARRVRGEAPTGLVARAAIAAPGLGRDDR